MKADLHIHSTASDMERWIREKIRRLAKAGLSCISLTDHDTVDGVIDPS